MAQVDEDTRITGTVTRFAAKRGFGFIKPTEGGKELFVHWVQISTSSKWPRLEKDMVVEYSPGTEEDGRKGAYNVTLEGGGDIDVEDESENRKLSTFRVTGTVKFFARAGYGFITTNKAITWPQKLPSGSEIYVSREDLEIAEESVCRLHKGQEVEFNVYKKEDKDGVAAANVTLPGGEAIVLAKEDIPSKGKGKGKKDGKGKSGGVKKAITKVPPKIGSKAVATRPAAPVKTAATSKGGKGTQSSLKGSGKSKGKGRPW